MKGYLIIVTLLVMLGFDCTAQNARFLTQGEIEYEKSLNMYAILGRSVNKSNETYLPKAIERYKEDYPQFKKLKSTLLFSNNLTYFVPEIDDGPKHLFDELPIVGQHNVIYSDLENNANTTSKTFLDKILLLNEPIRKIDWKLTDEFRNIAGFECRRANAIILDSVYVVAFYTEKILVSGGPETFNGLPGMILGVALPHENTTWFATKITDHSIPKELFKKPINGKAISYQELEAMIFEITKNRQNGISEYKAYLF